MRQMRFLSCVVCLLSLIGAMACAPVAPNPTPSVTNTGASPSDAAPSPSRVAPKEIVRARAGEVALKAGQSAETQVLLSIADGYHINANPPTDRNLIATELKVTPDAGITTGTPTYPEAIKKKFPFADQPLAVYQRTVTIKLPVRASRDAKTGGHSLSAVVRLQACDDEKCYPPTNVETSIPVSIR